MFKFISALIFFALNSCTSPKLVQTNDIVKPQGGKNNFLPVYISYYNNIPDDSIKRITDSLFKYNQISIITRQEMLDMNDREIGRASRLVFQKSVSDAEHALKDISSEQKFVANMLSIDFNYPASISWQSTPSPFKMDRPTQGKLTVISSDKLKDKSIREILTFLVGVILTSGELK